MEPETQTPPPTQDPTPAGEETPAPQPEPRTEPETQTEQAPTDPETPPQEETPIQASPTERIYTDGDRSKSLARKVAKKETTLTAIIDMVRTREELTVSDVEKDMGLKKSTARTYLETLVKRNLLAVRMDGRTRIYVLPTSSHN